MASLKDLKNRIASVKSTQKITKAMQMVAAAKLRRAQEAAEAARPYAERMGKVLAALGAAYAGRAGRAGAARRQRARTRCICWSSRPASAVLPAASTRRSRAWRASTAQKLISEGKTVKILTVGRKGNDILKRGYRRQDRRHHHVPRSATSSATSMPQQVGEKVLAMYEAGEFDVATLFFARFRSVISQIPTAQQLIPAKLEAATGDAAAARSTYEYEPDEEAILDDLLPRNISVQIFRALLENNASFYGAQMSAMDNATRNAGDMIKKLHAESTTASARRRSPKNSSKSFRARKRSSRTR